MATVQMNRFAAESGRMPPVCICCGSPAQQHVRHTFYYQPTWLVLIYILVPRPLKWYWSSNPAVVTVPVCAAHRHRLKWPKYIGYTLAGGLLLMVPALLGASIAQWHNAMGAMMLLVLVWLIGLWGTSVLVTLMTPRAEQYTTSLVTLTAVAPQFAQALHGNGVGMQQGASLQRGLGGPGLGGQTLGSPHRSAPKTMSGLRQGILVLLALGGGFLALLVFGFVIGFASYYARKARTQGARELAQRPMEPPAWAPPNIGPPPRPHIEPSSRVLPESPPNAVAPPHDLITQSNPATASAPSPAIPSPPIPTTPPPIPGASAAATENPANDSTFGEATRPVRGPNPPAGSAPVTPATPLPPGTQVWHLWGSQWYPAEVVSLAGANVRIHYYHYSANFDEDVPRDELRLPRPSSQSAASPSVASPPTSSAAMNDSAEPPSDPDVRTWTDSTGKFKIEAKLLEYADGKVKLERTDGKMITLPFEKLSPSDQFFVETKNP